MTPNKKRQPYTKKTVPKKAYTKTALRRAALKRAATLGCIYPMRLNKYMANKGLASRREADMFIKNGEVYVNGKMATLGTKVMAEDTIILGKGTAAVSATAGKRYFAYYKKAGITTTKEVGAKDILSVTEFPMRVFPVGRLDKDSEGLILMTNDGRVTEKLLHPRFFHEKEYRASLNHTISNTLLRGLKNGLRIGEFRVRPAQVRKYDERTIDIILTEGQNRQVRRMVAAFGYNVETLLRFRIENIELGTLKPGEFRELKENELGELLRRLHLA